jgi:NADH-quinone oxidoreductase subunit H
MDWTLVLEWLIKSILLILILMVGFAWGTLYERRVLARMQVRIGPNRAGPQGLLQPVADAFKLIFITVIPALIISAVVPWGTSITLFGREISLQLTDINLAVLYILTVTSISIYGITLAGWSSNNKYAMLGGLRATAQMISYELALGLSFVGPILIAGSMSLNDMVIAQRPIWFIFLQPLGAVIYGLTVLAEVNRSPFDMPEAEQELTAGYLTEYSGLKFALFFMAEYIKVVAVSMIGATVFLGGYLGPGVDQFPWLGPIYLAIKVLAIMFLMIWIRATTPRFRYDRLMSFGWKILFPLALLNVLGTAIVLLLVKG